MTFEKGDIVYVFRTPRGREYLPHAKTFPRNCRGIVRAWEEDCNMSCWGGIMTYEVENAKGDRAWFAEHDLTNKKPKKT